MTGGGLLFWGDLEQRFNAFDSNTGKKFWRADVGGIIQTSTITYAVDGRQYVVIMTGNGQPGTTRAKPLGRVLRVQGHNEICAFSLPEKCVLAHPLQSLQINLKQYLREAV